MNTPSTIREARLAALAEARKARSEVNTLKGDIKRYGAWASVQLDLYDDLDVLRERLHEAIQAMNWSYYYATRADAVAARDEAAAMRRAA